MLNLALLDAVDEDIITLNHCSMLQVVEATGMHGIMSCQAVWIKHVVAQGARIVNELCFLRKSSPL